MTDSATRVKSLIEAIEAADAEGCLEQATARRFYRSTILPWGDE